MAKAADEVLKRLSIPPENRSLLCLDGGGIKGIMTIQLLKALEERAGAACYEIFDMVAGTSTGGIIAGLIVSGHNATQIEDLYEKFLLKVFVKRSLFSNQVLDPPIWTKASYRQVLKDTLADVTLQQTCDKFALDMLITAHDVAEGEETFFSYVRSRPAARNAYATILLRAAMEATMCAPTYFNPLERFVDGGVTAFNNPALAAIIEAIQYGGQDYSMDKLSVFSFGTGCRTELMQPNQVPNPPGLDTPFWLCWLMNESGNDASDLQSDLLRASRVCGHCDYRRFQLSLDQVALSKLPAFSLADVHATDAATTRDLTDKELAGIHIDNVAYFPVMQVIGQAFAQYLKDHSASVQKPIFSYDLVDANGKELLVTRTGDVSRIAEQMSDPRWLDAQLA
jgi:hypothetical protein